MIQPITVKTVIKRGALVAAANWQLTAIQFVADSTLKMLISVPVVGGVLLVALVLGRDLPELVGGDLRASVAFVASALLAEPYALAAFLVALALVAGAGAAFMVLVKGGTVVILAQAEREAAPVEEPPLVLRLFWTAATFSIERYQIGCARVFRRYLRLALLLGAIYAISAAAYLGILFGRYGVTLESGLDWTLAAVTLSAAMVLWITLINFFYLLIQAVIVVEDCSVRNGARRVFGFLRAAPRLAFSVLGVMLGLFLGATFVSLIATTSLGLIAFVPLAGLAVVPLQLVAWMFRGVVFQYLGLSALGAYLSLYRRHASAGSETVDEPPAPLTSLEG
ncbi:MAG: hypothetical protein NTV05_08525 [Acidobacteria bacterium]|nr:hypothetical protein [Acidobacteriota bacterium]